MLAPKDNLFYSNRAKAAAGGRAGHREDTIQGGQKPVDKYKQSAVDLAAGLGPDGGKRQKITSAPSNQGRWPSPTKAQRWGR